MFFEFTLELPLGTRPIIVHIATLPYSMNAHMLLREKKHVWCEDFLALGWCVGFGRAYSGFDSWI